MLRFAVCDDEPLLAEELSARVGDYMARLRRGGFRVDLFSGGQALLDSGEGFDLVFLDIRMDGPDGLETARELRRRRDGCLLVFVTVLRELVFDVFEVRPFDYLVKPLEEDRFRRTMDRALQALERRTSLILRRGPAREVVPLDEIVYCEVQGRALFLHLTDGRVLEGRGRLEELICQLDGRFFRCHRSYLASLDRVRGYGGGRVVLTDGEEIPLSRLRERDLAQALLVRLREEAR